MTRYFGFAIADSMFPSSEDVLVYRTRLSTEEAKYWVGEYKIQSCLNPSHAATIAAMKTRFGIDVEIPATPPKVELKVGDGLVVMGVRGLPRLTDRHEYSAEEISAATFEFHLYMVGASTNQ